MALTLVALIILVLGLALGGCAYDIPPGATIQQPSCVMFCRTEKDSVYGPRLEQLTTTDTDTTGGSITGASRAGVRTNYAPINDLYPQSNDWKRAKDQEKARVKRGGYYWDRAQPGPVRTKAEGEQ